MTDQFIAYETAKTMRELGFNEPCFFCYREDSPGKVNLYNATDGPEGYSNEEGIDVAAPTYQQAFEWFRKEYGMLHAIVPNRGDFLYFYGHTFFRGSMGTVTGTFVEYREAEKECLRKLIEDAEALKSIT